MACRSCEFHCDPSTYKFLDFRLRNHGGGMLRLRSLRFITGTVALGKDIFGEGFADGDVEPNQQLTQSSATETRPI
jgi:hypothetical protein